MNSIVNLGIIAVTVIVSLLAFQRQDLLRELLLDPLAIKRRGQYYRLVSYGLVHADGQHLLFNMITLFFFGGLSERLISQYLGSGGYVLFYTAALVVSILPSYLQNRNNPHYLSLGASGAVSAVLFIYVILAPWSLIFVFFIPVPAIVFAALYIGYSIYMDRRRSDNVNHSAHLVGAAFGMLFVVIMEPRLLGNFFRQLLTPLAG
jgi:membrane associated rhomboid family serine protease